MKRWGMRYHSVSRTRAGPIATPGETAIPRLISMPPPRVRSPTAAQGSGVRNKGVADAWPRVAESWSGRLVVIVIAFDILQHPDQGVEGQRGVGTIHLDRHLAPLQRPQPHQLQ